VADRLGADLDIVLVHKLRAPMQPELAIGAVDEFGNVYLADFAREDDISREYLEAEKREQLAALEARRRLYTPVHAPLDASGRTVILVDDGIATGSTMVAAIRSVRLHKAAKVIVATPVAPPDTVEHLENEADLMRVMPKTSASQTTTIVTAAPIQTFATLVPRIITAMPMSAAAPSKA
jgi:predicted phosphoribosyltransferase